MINAGHSGNQTSPINGYLLITGLSGYVGDHLARQISKWHFPIAGTFYDTPIAIPDVDSAQLDATDPRAVGRLIRDMKPAAIVHCAAQTNTSWCEQWVDEARLAITGATQNLVEAVLKYAPEIPVIGFSSDLVFGGEEAPYAEDAKPNPINVYGRCKAEAEESILQLPRGMVLRSALIYGPPASIRSSCLSWMASKLADWEDLILFEDEWRTPIFVDDLGTAVEALLRQPPAQQHGIYHAAGADRLSRLEMGRVLAEVFGLPEQPIRGTTRSAVNQEKVRARDVSLQCRRLHELGWKPTPFSNGLQACLQRWSALRPDPSPS